MPPITQSSPTPVPTFLPSGYEPQPGDDKLKRDQVFLDAVNCRLVVNQSLPVQVSLILNGNLSDPCHQLRVVVTSANNRVIDLEVYSIFNPKTVCITVLQPFSAILPLGSFTSGQYTVTVNGMTLGSSSACPATTALGTAQ